MRWMKQLKFSYAWRRADVTDRNRYAWHTAGAYCLTSLAALLLCLNSAATGTVRHGQKAPGTDLVKSGTGFFVSHDGLIATSAHVVSGCPEITIWPANGPERVARIVALDIQRDVALLSVAGEVSIYASRIHERGSLRPGEPVSTIGFGVLPSKPREPVVTAGHLAGDAADSEGNRILLIQARFLEGNSGGPVIDGEGSLLGVVVGRDATRPDLGAARPSEAIEGLLSANGVARPLSLPEARPPIDAAGLLRSISVLVQCAPAGHRVPVPSGD
jgi:S1-C subfamily serine protease